MSFALMTYVVDLDLLRSCVGSQDDKLRRMIGGRFKQHLASFDDQLATEDGPSIRDAIRAVIHGGPYDERHGHMYGYAYKWICEFHGRALVNSEFCPMRAGWLETVDEGLASLGVTAVSLAEFNYGRVPDAIPTPELVPAYDEWTLDECRQALEQWEAVPQEKKDGLDPYVLAAAETSMGWCRAASAAERGVAGFFS